MEGWGLVVIAVALLFYHCYVQRYRIPAQRAQEHERSQASLRLTLGEGIGAWVPPYLIHSVTVTNDGPAAACNVRLSVQRITPEPPYPLYHMPVPILLHTLPKLERNQWEQCRMAKSWITMEGVVHISFYGVKDSPKIPLPAGENWEIQVVASANNAEEISATFFISPNETSATVKYG